MANNYNELGTATTGCELTQLTQANVGEVWDLPPPYTPIPIIPDRHWDPSCFIIGYWQNTTLALELRPDAGSRYVYVNTGDGSYQTAKHLNSFRTRRIFTKAEAKATLTHPPQSFEGAVETKLFTHDDLFMRRKGDIWSVPSPYIPIPSIFDRGSVIIGFHPDNNTTLGVHVRTCSETGADSYVYVNTGGQGNHDKLPQFDTFTSTRLFTSIEYQNLLRAAFDTNPYHVRDKQYVSRLGRRLTEFNGSQVGEIWTVPAPFRPATIIPDRAWDPSCFIIGYHPVDNTTLAVQLRPDSTYVYVNTGREHYKALTEFNDFFSTRLIGKEQYFNQKTFGDDSGNNYRLYNY